MSLFPPGCTGSLRKVAAVSLHKERREQSPSGGQHNSHSVLLHNWRLFPATFTTKAVHIVYKIACAMIAILSNVSCLALDWFDFLVGLFICLLVCLFVCLFVCWLACSLFVLMCVFTFC